MKARRPGSSGRRQRVTLAGPGRPGQELGQRTVEAPDGARREVLVNDAESPVAWLARRAGPGGRPFLAPEEAAAGERLREDFTRAGLSPRVTTSWSTPSGNGGRPMDFADAVLAALQRVHQALDAVGPELSGVLLDVCCFLKGLEQVEAAEAWPQRSAKIVLKIALQRLARHYGLIAARPARPRLRHWGSENYRPSLGEPTGEGA